MFVNCHKFSIRRISVKIFDVNSPFLAIEKGGAIPKDTLIELSYLVLASDGSSFVWGMLSGNDHFINKIGLKNCLA